MRVQLFGGSSPPLPPPLGLLPTAMHAALLPTANSKSCDTSIDRLPAAGSPGLQCFNHRWQWATDDQALPATAASHSW